MEVGEEVVAGPKEFVAGIRERKKGDVVRLELYRRGQPMEVEAELAERISPEAAVLRELEQQFFVVPKVTLRKSPQGSGASTLILRGPAPIPDEDGAFGTLSLEDAEDVDLDLTAERVAEPVSKVRKSSTRVITVEDGEHSIFLRANDDDRHVTVLDADGKKVFEGPANAKADLEALPRELRERIERIEREVEERTKPKGPGKPIRELRIYKPGPAPDFIQTMPQSIGAARLTT